MDYPIPSLEAIKTSLFAAAWNDVAATEAGEQQWRDWLASVHSARYFPSLDNGAKPYSFTDGISPTNRYPGHRS